ncbi:MAG TPA: DUF6134 family protein [Caldimonas sp.]|nr:DUF6134 family protein [Caldimonas sp.]
MAALALAVAALPGPSAAAELAPTGDWSFRVLLDDKPIGQHRFSVQAEGAETRVLSEARFDVTVLGLTAYRYRHRASESWLGNCLTALAATTDDDGTTSDVRLVSKGDRQTIRSASGAEASEGCLMSFAYWHPAMRTQTRLLNAQTGKIEPVQVRLLGEARIDVRGVARSAVGYRVAGAARPVDVWYSADGDWIGLDAIVAGGRRLSYRLP